MWFASHSRESKSTPWIACLRRIAEWIPAFAGMTWVLWLAQMQNFQSRDGLSNGGAKPPLLHGWQCEAAYSLYINLNLVVNVNK